MHAGQRPPQAHPIPDSSVLSSENSIIHTWPVLPSGRGEAERGQQGRPGGTCPGVTANNSPVPRRPEAVGIQGDILEGCGSWENVEEGSGEHAEMSDTEANRKQVCNPVNSGSVCPQRQLLAEATGSS